MTNLFASSKKDDTHMSEHGSFTNCMHNLPPERQIRVHNIRFYPCSTSFFYLANFSTVFFFRQLLLRYKVFLFLGKEKMLFIVHGKVCCGVLLLFSQHSWARRFVSKLFYDSISMFLLFYYFEFRSICVALNIYT